MTRREPATTGDGSDGRGGAEGVGADGVPARSVGPYELFVLGLSVWVLGALAARSALPLDAETVRVLEYADHAICVIFLADFFRNLLLAESRGAYLLRWGWIDLLSSLPTVDVLRWGRAARLFRIVRVLRAQKAARALGSHTLRYTAEHLFWGTLLASVLVTIVGAIAILHLEAGEGGNLRGASDALWWAFVTITTVGYGDHYPITGAGRLVAALLMICGIGLFGSFTAYLAGRMLGRDRDEPGPEAGVELAALRREVEELRHLVDARSPAGPKASSGIRPDAAAGEASAPSEDPGSAARG